MNPMDITLNNLYKYSQFNIEVDTKENGDKYIFNTYTCKGLWIDKEDQKLIIDKSDIDPLDISQDIVENGIVIDNTLDELQRIKDHYTNISTRDDILMFTIIPSMACNYRCKYCFEGDRTHNKQVMSEETIEATAKFIADRYNELPNVKVVQIKWFGGEPLLHLDIIEKIYSELDKYNIPTEYWMFSNGRLLTPAYAERLSKYRQSNHKITITIDGLPDTNAKVKDCSINDLDIVLNNIKNVQAKLNIVLKINVSNSNKHEIMQIIELLNNIKLFIPVKLERTYGSDDSIEYNEIHKIINETEQYVKDRHYNINILKNSEVRICEGNLKNHYTIAPDGALYRCENTTNVEEYQCGSIFTGFKETEISHYFTDFNLEEKCINCKYLPMCYGSCRYSRLTKSDRFVCEKFLERKERQLKVLADRNK